MVVLASLVPSLWVLICICIACSGATSTSEIQALTDLFDSTKGTYWEQNENWGVGDPCKDAWYGVNCDDKDESVTSINLSFNSLQGTIPDSIAQLSFLTRLDLFHNSISGTIPTSLSALTNLKTLNLYDNFLTGSVPSELSQLKNLQTLDLSSNGLSGQLPDIFNSFASLKILQLSNNQISGSIPSSIFTSLPNSTISLKTNLLSSIPWDSWTNASLHLHTSLDLSNNKLEGDLSHKIYWTKTVDLSNNAFSGPLPEYDPSLGLSTTVSIDLSLCHLTGGLPESISMISSLHSFSVDYNDAMTGQIPDEFALMTNLTTLTFYDTQITCPNTPDWQEFERRTTTSCYFDLFELNGIETLLTLYFLFIVVFVFCSCAVLGCLVRSALAPRGNHLHQTLSSEDPVLASP